MRTIKWSAQGPQIELIDQRLLPGEFRVVSLHTVDETAAAIRDMVVRGAPAIGATAAFGIALAGAKSPANTSTELLRDLKLAGEQLIEARPTAVNLAWAVQRILEAVEPLKEAEPRVIRQMLIEEAQRLADEDVEINRRIGLHGAELIPQSSTVIHHCNTGSLATVDYGTALGVIRTAHEQGKQVHVLVDETRPRLQGSRLTAWELEQYSIPYEIITDNAAGYFLAKGEVSAVFVGADRVVANGDIANKIGTYMLALAASDNNVPFYCAVPTSTIDLSIPSGREIVIEERDPSEVLNLTRDGMALSPASSRARNPAFDITPHRLVSAFISERGIHRPPYSRSLKEAVKGA